MSKTCLRPFTSSSLYHRADSKISISNNKNQGNWVSYQHLRVVLLVISRIRKAVLAKPPEIPCMSRLILRLWDSWVTTQKRLSPSGSLLGRNLGIILIKMGVAGIYLTASRSPRYQLSRRRWCTPTSFNISRTTREPNKKDSIFFSLCFRMIKINKESRTTRLKFTF